MFCNESVNNLAILLDCFQFIGQGKFNFNVTPMSDAFIFIGGVEKFFGVIVRPLWQVVKLKDTAASFFICSFSIYVLGMGNSRLLFQCLFHIFQNFFSSQLGKTFLLVGKIITHVLILFAHEFV